MRRILFALMLMIIGIPAQAVIINGKDWRQLTDTVGFTYNDLTGSSGPCDAATGVCTGAATNRWGDVRDFSGWTWASRSDVAGLFDYLIPTPTTPYFDPPGSLLPGAIYYENNSAWAPAIVDDGGAVADGVTGLFGYTQRLTDVDYDFFRVVGITRTCIENFPDSSDCLLTSYAAVDYNILDTGLDDDAATSGHQLVDYAERTKGMWLYRPVPEPATLALVGIGLAGIGYARKKKRDFHG